MGSWASAWAASRASWAARHRATFPGSKVKCVTAETFMNTFVAALRSGDMNNFRSAYRGLDLLCIDDVHFLSNKTQTQNELLHTFGIDHCVAWRCLMNAYVPESRSAQDPQLALCPMDLRKLQYAVKFDVRDRFRCLEACYGRLPGLQADLSFVRQRRSFFSGE